MARCHEYGYSREQSLSMSVLIKSHSTRGLKNCKYWFDGFVRLEHSRIAWFTVFVLFVRHHNDQPRGTAFFSKSSDHGTSQLPDRLYLKQRQQLTAS
jgi:hypothetical protein